MKFRRSQMIWKTIAVAALLGLTLAPFAQGAKPEINWSFDTRA